MEYLEVIEGIQQGFEEINSGKTRPLADFAQEMAEKYGISG
jgi:hypothetical protein